MKILFSHSSPKNLKFVTCKSGISSLLYSYKQSNNAKAVLYANMLLLCRQLKKYCFVLTVYMILFYAETSISFFSMAKIGLSVTICQAQSIGVFNVKGFWKKFTAGQRAASHLCITEVSHLSEPIQLIYGFAFLLLAAGGKGKH